MPEKLVFEVVGIVIIEVEFTATAKTFVCCDSRRLRRFEENTIEVEPVFTCFTLNSVSPLCLPADAPLLVLCFFGFNDIKLFFAETCMSSFDNSYFFCGKQWQWKNGVVRL